MCAPSGARHPAHSMHALTGACVPRAQVGRGRVRRWRADKGRWRLRGGGGGWEGLGGRRRGQQRAKRGQMTQAGGAGQLGGWGVGWTREGGCASPGGALRVVRTSASGSSMLRFVSVGMLAHGKINYHVCVQRSPTGAALIKTILKRPTGSKNCVPGEPFDWPALLGIPPKNERG